MKFRWSVGWFDLESKRGVKYFLRSDSEMDNILDGILFFRRFFSFKSDSFKSFSWLLIKFISMLIEIFRCDIFYSEVDVLLLE